MLVEQALLEQPLQFPLEQAHQRAGFVEVCLVHLQPNMRIPHYLSSGLDLILLRAPLAEVVSQKAKQLPGFLGGVRLVGGAQLHRVVKTGMRSGCSCDGCFAPLPPGRSHRGRISGSGRSLLFQHGCYWLCRVLLGWAIPTRSAHPLGSCRFCSAAETGRR